MRKLNVFGFTKRKVSGPPTVPPASNRFHVLMLSGDAAAVKKITDPLLELSEDDQERTAFFIDDDGGGGMVVTCEDPSNLKALYKSLGLKVGLVSIPSLRAHENAYLVGMDLRLTGEYRELRRRWLSA